MIYACIVSFSQVEVIKVKTDKQVVSAALCRGSIIPISENHILARIAEAVAEREGNKDWTRQLIDRELITLFE